ncbi:MAG TPA: SDR family NAD(P)-dependent oxidoreductase [Polyangia bacterium]|jgi:3-oxoacyl-[acyl-carrier protein] reductase
MSAADLTGKVAIVTGAGQGLGRAYAVALARAGAAVIVNDLDLRVAEETAGLAGGRATAMAGDVGDRATADALVARAVEAFGRLDVVVTNAGVLRDAVLWKMTDEDFDLVVRTHLRGTFLCARAAAIRMREQAQGGRIIVVGSPAGQHGNFGQTNYAAAKAGIVGFARTWAAELARAEITVNAIVPTAWTAMTATIPLYKPLVSRVAAGEPLPAAVRREHAIGMPEDCAGLVVFLASGASAGITGQTIGIGGDRICLYSHPAEIATELRDGGWDAEAIAAIWQARFAPHLQPFGIRLPKLDLA